MNRRNTPDVRPLVDRLVNREPSAVEELRGQLPSILKRNLEAFQRAVPNCARCEKSLIPHVGYAAASGFLNATNGQETAAFVAYAERLRLSDLYHASACLPWRHYPVPDAHGDTSAVQSLHQIVMQRIYPTLRKKYGRDQCVDDAVDQLTAHVLLPATDGEARLAAYSGRCRLDSWLTTIGVNMVNSCLRGHRAIGEDDNSTAAAPERVGSHAGESEQSLVFIRRFYQYIVELVHGVADEERLSRIAEAFSLTDLEREKYRSGLTDRQKLVFQLLYFKGMSPSAVAELLLVTRPCINHFVNIYRERLRVLAFAVIDEIADVADVSVDVIIESLTELLQFFRRREWDSEWEELSKGGDAFQQFVDELRRHRDA